MFRINSKHEIVKHEIAVFQTNSNDQNLNGDQDLMNFLEGKRGPAAQVPQDKNLTIDSTIINHLFAASLL